MVRVSLTEIMQTSGGDSTAASMYKLSVSKVIISFSVYSLPFKESISMLVIYLSNTASDQTVQLPLVTCCHHIQS